MIIEISGRFIPNFAWQHLRAASIFRERLVALETEHAGQPFGNFFEEIRSMEVPASCLQLPRLSL